MTATGVFKTSIVFNGSVWRVKINDTELKTGFKRKVDAELISKFISLNAQEICNAVSAILGSGDE